MPALAGTFTLETIPSIILPTRDENTSRFGHTMSKFSIVKEFWDFLKSRKRWWLAPIVFFLLVLGALLVFAKGSALAPFIYSLF